MSFQLKNQDFPQIINDTRVTGYQPKEASVRFIDYVHSRCQLGVGSNGNFIDFILFFVCKISYNLFKQDQIIFFICLSGFAKYK